MLRLDLEKKPPPAIAGNEGLVELSFGPNSVSKGRAIQWLPAHFIDDADASAAAATRMHSILIAATPGCAGFRSYRRSVMMKSKNARVLAGKC